MVSGPRTVNQVNGFERRRGGDESFEADARHAIFRLIQFKKPVLSDPCSVQIESATETAPTDLEVPFDVAVPDSDSLLRIADFDVLCHHVSREPAMIDHETAAPNILDNELIDLTVVDFNGLRYTVSAELDASFVTILVDLFAQICISSNEYALNLGVPIQRIFLAVLTRAKLNSRTKGTVDHYASAQNQLVQPKHVAASMHAVVQQNGSAPDPAEGDSACPAKVTAEEHDIAGHLRTPQTEMLRERTIHEPDISVDLCIKHAKVTGKHAIREHDS